MARVCELCEKSTLKGNLVPRGIGRRVTRRTIRHQKPNLRTVRMALEEGGNKVTLRICTSCLKKLKRENKTVEEGVVESKTTVEEESQK